MNYLEIPSTTGSEREIRVYRSWDGDVDFCVWVLEVDGLQVPPFTHHADGNGQLRAQGLTRSDWQQWISRVVVCRDPRLLWGLSINELLQYDHVDLIEYGVELGVDASLVDREQMEAFEQRQAQQAQAQHRVAIAQLPSDVSLAAILSGVSPLDLWMGSSEVGEHLTKLWQEYRSQPPRSRSDIDAMMATQMPAIADRVQALHLEISMLDVYFVRYPALLSYVCSAVGGLISIPPQSRVDQVVCG